MRARDFYNIAALFVMNRNAREMMQSCYGPITYSDFLKIRKYEENEAYFYEVMKKEVTRVNEILYKTKN
jgi:hypothetical protein